jgi:O-antigen ligase
MSLPVYGAAVASAFALGGLFTIGPVLGAAVLGALCFVPLAMFSVPAAVAAWAAALFLTNISGLAISWMLLVIAAAWLGSAIATRAKFSEILPGQRVLVGSLVSLAAWLSLSVLWARDAQVAWQALRPWLTAIAAVVIVASTIRSPGQLRLVLAGFVFGGLVSIVIGLLGAGPHQSPGLGFPTPPSNRFTGAEGNPNDLAAQLLPAIVLAAGLAIVCARLLTRGMAIVALAALTAAFVATQSRGGLVAAGVVVLAGLVIYQRSRRQMALALVLAIAVAGATLALNPAALNRVTTINDGGNGRSTLWLVAWRMAKHYQPEGVGLDNFRVVAPSYVRQPGALRYVDQIDSPHIVHNTYLQLLAETGFVGLGLFLTFGLACIAAARRATRIFDRLGLADLAGLARAVMLAGVAVLADQLSGTSVGDMRFWFVLALGPALLTIAGRQLSQPALKAK